MYTVAHSTQDVTVGPDLTQLDSLRPYASLQIVRHPDDAPCVDEILRALPPLLQPINVDKLVADIDKLLPAGKRRPRWFGKVAELLGVSRRIRTSTFLTTLTARLRESSENPPVNYANGRSASRGSDLAKRVCVLIGLDPALYHRRILMTLHPPGTANDGLEVGALGYLEQRIPGWWSHDRPGPVDRLYQLVLVCRRRTENEHRDKASRYLALYASEPAAKLRIARAIGTDEPLDSFTRIDPQVLDAAFIKRDKPLPAHDAKRRIRTLWLSGIHPSAAWKPDAKVLVGHDLENALEPLADQTYYFSAARCYVPVAGDRLTVGVAPRRSSLWAGSVPSWRDFRDRTIKLLDHISSSKPVKGGPIAVLADQVEVENAKEIAGAYDLSVICPELLAEDPDLPPAVLAQAERWAYRAHFFDFRPKAKTGPAFTVRVAVDDAYVGELDIEFERSRDGWRPVVGCPAYKPPRRSVLEHESVSLMRPANEAPGHDPFEKSRHKLHVEAAAVCRRPGWLTVRYESGHTLSGGALFSTRYRDVEFKNWEWDDLSNRDYNIWQEKPMVDKATGEPVLERPEKGIETKADLSRIGQDRSLFCWVQRNWPVNTPSVSSGWLACDDGAGEIADFIHLDPDPQDGGSPLLSLIHVKASHSRSPDREISTSDYEIVVGQAVKNLRSLDRINLAERLEDGAKKAVGKAVWKDGVKTTRKKMIGALNGLGGNYRRQVVIVQPRVTVGEYEQVKKDRKADQDTPRVRRMQQLDTLLVGAQAECHALQAKLLVVGDSIAGKTGSSETEPKGKRSTKAIGK